MKRVIKSIMVRIGWVVLIAYPAIIKMDGPKFRERSEDEYSRLRTSELFDIFMYKFRHEQIHPADMHEMEKVQKVLLGKPLPDKRYFYQSLEGWKKRTYKGFLIIK
jgi:hypothetical protein